MTLFARLKSAWRALSSVEPPPAKAPVRPLYTRDPYFLGPKPTRYTRLLALKYHQDRCIEKALAAQNRVRYETLCDRSRRLVTALIAEIDPRRKQIYPHEDCACPSCLAKGKTKAGAIKSIIEGILSGKAQVIPIEISQAPASGVETTPAGAELDALVERLRRRAQQN